MDEEQSKISPQFLVQVDKSDDHSLRKGMEEQRLGGKDDQFIFTHVEFDKSVDYPHEGIQQAIDYEDLIEVIRTTWIRSRDFKVTMLLLEGKYCQYMRLPMSIVQY